MNALDPLATLYDALQCADLPLPPALASLYGRLAFPTHPSRPSVIGNFVTTLDGVVSLNVPGQSGGGSISGQNAHDRMVMGLLRAVADVVIVGAGHCGSRCNTSGLPRTFIHRSPMHMGSFALPWESRNRH